MKSSRTFTPALFVMTPLLTVLPALMAPAGTLSFNESATSAHIDVEHDTLSFIHANYTAGGAVGDFNKDGWQDLFVISGGAGGQPDYLFINNGDGTFTDMASEWGLSEVHMGKGASVGDFNHDGWLDIYETSAGPAGSVQPGNHRLYRNNGNGTFTNVAADAGVNFTTQFVQDGFGSTFGDIDRDGDLDLFVAGFEDHAGNRLFRHNGDDTYTDITDDINLFATTPNNISGFAPRLIDMDGDWYADLILVADFGTSRYFKNDGDGTFTDWTSQGGVGQETDGMGHNVGYVNDDLLIDYYVTSIEYFSTCSGNKLYFNQGNHAYDEVACDVGVDAGGYGWGNVLIDFNNDGLVDICETNGDSGGGGIWSGEQSYLWLQQADGNFEEVALDTGLLHFGSGRGMVNLDYDNDGDQDIVIFENEGDLTLFRNGLSGDDINWLRIFLDSTDSDEVPSFGYGAIVRATVGDHTQSRMMTSGDNFLSHSELSAHFGLGIATSVDTLAVEWPNGEVTILTDVAANQSITIELETAPDPANFNGDGTVGPADLAQLLGSWGPCPDRSDCPADINRDGTVGPADLAMLLGSWG